MLPFLKPRSWMQTAGGLLVPRSLEWGRYPWGAIEWGAREERDGMGRDNNCPPGCCGGGGGEFCCTLCSGNGSPSFFDILVQGLSGSNAVFNGTWLDIPSLGPILEDGGCRWEKVFGNTTITLDLFYQYQKQGHLITTNAVLVMKQGATQTARYSQCIYLGIHDCFQANWKFNYTAQGALLSGDVTVNAKPEASPQKCSICCGQQDIPAAAVASFSLGTGRYSCLNGYVVFMPLFVCTFPAFRPYYDNLSAPQVCGSFSVFSQFFCVTSTIGDDTYDDTPAFKKYRYRLDMTGPNSMILDTVSPLCETLTDDCVPFHKRYRWTDNPSDTVTVDVTP